MNRYTLDLPFAEKIKVNGVLKNRVFILFIFVFTFSGLSSFSQVTYTWAGGATASWATAGSWNPVRTTPAANDIMVFSGGGTVTATAIPVQTIGRLLVSGNTIVNLQSAAANTLSIAGVVSGDDLTVASGSQLNISGSTVLIISLSTTATGSISGNMTTSSSVASTPHQLLAADASAITFNSGAIFTQSTNSTGTVFGSSGTANTIIFASGSTFTQGAGSSPFGLSQPSSKVVFQTGSLFKLIVANAPSMTGRTYANFEYAPPSGTATATGGTGYSIDNLTVTTGILNLNVTAASNIKGNISVASGATLGFTPASAGSISFSGTTAQTITNAGTLTFSANAAVVIANTASPIPSVTFNQAQTISGSMTVNAGSILATSGTLTLSGSPAINGTFQINGGGWATGGTWAYTNGTLAFNNSSGSYGVNADVWWPAANGPTNVTVAGAGGITMNVARTVSGVFQTAAGVINANNLTLNGTGKLNTGGFFAAIPVWGASSTLIYNTGGTFGRGNEFPNSGNLPSNVQVSNNTTINYPNAGLAARTLTGNLTIDAGSALYMDYGNPNPGVGILTINSLILNGNMSLGNQTGGDLIVKGNFTRTGTFTTNGRAVFFNAATGNQTITGSTSFDYLIVDKAAGSVVLANNITVNQIITLTNGTVNTAANNVIISNNATGAVVRTNGYVNGNLQRAINTGANTYNFAIGTSQGYTPASFAFTAVGAAGNISISSSDAVGANYPSSLNSSKRLARSWTAVNSGVTGITGSATFTYLTSPSDLVGGAVSGNLKAYVHNGGYVYPTSNSNSSNSFTFNGLTTLGEFGAGECKGTMAPTFVKSMATGCGGGTDGSITVTPAGGTAPYTYSWTGPGGFTASTAAISSLATGDYTVVITEATGCTVSIPNITIWQALTPVVTYNAGNSGGCGNSGLIILYGSYGVAPFTYSIDGTNYFASNTFTNIAPGNYTGYVKDAGASGCIGTNTNIVIGSSPALIVTAYARNASSCAANGSIELYRTGGTPPYTYSLDDITYFSGNTFNNLAAGTYTGWVKDGKNCITSLGGITVGAASAVTISATKSNTNACSNTGYIELHAGGGVPGYTYSLNNGAYQSSNSFTGLAAGSYDGRVKDSKNCVNVLFGIVLGTDPATMINVTAYARSTSSCANTGSIELYRTGGVGPFTYSLDNISYQSSNTFTGKAAGAYTGWVKDSKGCTGSLGGITITQSSAVTVTESHTSTSVCVNDGTIQLRPSGGVLPYTFSLDDITYQAGSSFTGLASGNYTGWVKDVNGCKNSVNLTINQNTIIVTSYAGPASSCEISNGTIQLFRTGGTGPYTYSINGTNFFSSNTFTGLTSGVYDGYVKDSKNCLAVKLDIVVGPDCAPPIANNSRSQINISKENSISIIAFPNPSASEFILSLENINSQHVSVVITDILGRIVYQAEGKGKQQYRFGSNFKAGMYFLKVLQGANEKSLKLIKQ